MDHVYGNWQGVATADVVKQQVDQLLGLPERSLVIAKQQGKVDLLG